MQPLSDETQSLLQSLHRLASRPRWLPVRRDAEIADLLGQIGRQGELAALPYLVRSLISGSETVRRAAAGGVHDILVRQSDDALIQMESEFASWIQGDWGWHPDITSRSSVRARDVNRLEADPASRTSVLGLLSFHRSGYVREAAVRHLRKSRDGSELPYLLIRLNDWVEPVAALAYTAVTERLSIEYLPHFAAHLPLVMRLLRLGRFDDANITRRVVMLLAQPPFEPALIEAIRSSDRVVRRDVVRVALGLCDKRREPSRAKPAPLGAVTSAQEGHDEHDVKCRVVAHGLDSGDAVIRLWCARGVRDCFSGEQLRVTLGRLKQDRSMPVRRESLRIEAAAYPHLEREIWRAALLDPSIAIRELARVRLRDLGGCEPAAVYREALRGNPDSLPALAGLGESGDASDLPALRSYLNDPTSRRRMAALRGIARIAADNATDELIEYLRDPSPKVVRVAAQLLQERLYGMDLSRLDAVVRQSPYEHCRLISLRLIFEAGKWPSLPGLIRASDHWDHKTGEQAAKLFEAWLYSNRVFTRPSESERREIHDALAELPEAKAARLRNQLELDELG